MYDFFNATDVWAMILSDHSDSFRENRRRSAQNLQRALLIKGRRCRPGCDSRTDIRIKFVVETPFNSKDLIVPSAHTRLGIGLKKHDFNSAQVG